MKQVSYFFLVFFIFISTSKTSAFVVFSEIAWMGTASSAYDEWIELYNFYTESVDLTGWVIESSDKKLSIPLVGNILAPENLSHSDRFFLLERTDDSSTSISADQIYTGALNNTGLQLFLKNKDGEIIDQTPINNWPAGDNSNKKSMERIDFTANGNQENNWNTFSGAPVAVDAKDNPINGSPKQRNSETPPELFDPKPILFEQKEFSANILQITPTTFSDQAEWFSVQIESEGAVDITDWIISNGKTEKKIINLQDKIKWIDNDFSDKNLSGTTHEGIIYEAEKIYLLPKFDTQKNKFSGIFYFEKSPVSLSDNGGTLIIKKGTEEILDQKNFPKPTKTTINNKKFRETFLYESATMSSFLQTENHFKPVDFIYTAIQKPTPTTEVELFISEIAPIRFNEPDFIEIFIAKAPANGANIKYTEIKHNGSKILFFPDDYIVHEGDFLLIYFDKGSTRIKKENKHIFSSQARSSVSSTSGTIEINYFANTSQKLMKDFSCWYKESLNKTESSRVQKLNKVDHCVQIEFSTQESWAKNNLFESYFSHLHGTPGEKNLAENIKNFRPIAQITRQSGSINSINVTGQDSIDNNGEWDLKNFYWQFKFGEKEKEKTFATFFNNNPISQSLDLHKSLTEDSCKNSHYKIELKINDSLGLSSKDFIYYPLYWDKYCKIGTIKEETKQIEEKKWTEPEKKAKDIWKNKYFFEAFEEKGTRAENPLPPITPKKIYHTQYDRIIHEKGLTPNQIKKNIGLIFMP